MVFACLVKTWYGYIVKFFYFLKIAVPPVPPVPLQELRAIDCGLIGTGFLFNPYHPYHTILGGEFLTAYMLSSDALDAI